MEENNLTDIGHDEELLKFEDDAENDGEEKETPSASSADEETKDEEESDSSSDEEVEKTEEEENVPFHKHPRWQTLHGELKELRSFKDEVSPLLEKIKENNDNNEVKEIPRWFAETFGENETAYREYVRHSNEERAKIKQEVISQIKKEQQEQQEKATKWQGWVDSEVQSLEDEGLEFNKNKLLKVMEDYRPVDSEGNLNFKKGYEILQMLNNKKVTPKEDTKGKKEVAAKTMSKDRVGDDNKRDYLTPDDLRHRGFSDY